MGGNLLQPVKPRFQRPARVHSAQRRQRLGEGAGGIKQRQIGRAACRLQPARILGIQLAPHRFDLVGVQREGLRAEGVDQIGQREIDRDARQPCRCQRLNRQHHHFACGSNAVRADQFCAQLQAFTCGIKLAGLDHHRIAAIGQPQRAGGIGKAGGGDPPDLRGDVAAQRQRAQAGGIDQPEHRARFTRNGPRHPPSQRGFKLQQRRAHPVITMRVQHIETGAHHRGDARGFQRKTVF